MFAVLWLWFVLLTVTLFTGWHATYHADDTISTRISLFSITIVQNGSMVFSSSWIVVLWLVVSLIISFAAATGVSRACRPFVSPAKWLALGSVSAVAVAVFASACWARSYWGYWISRPAANGAWWQIERVKSFGGVSCEMQRGHWRCVTAQAPTLAKIAADCASDSYYCLEERLPVSLSHAGVQLPNIALSETSLRALETVLGSRGVVVRAEPGYSGDRVLAGYAVSGAAWRRRGQLLAFALSAPEISNDHHPMYEIVADAATRPPQILRKRVFYYDVAGIEGAEPPRLVLASVILMWCVTVPASLLAAVWLAHRRRVIWLRSKSTA
ncbi:MAG TPA: hypothetical protein VJ276_09405 [Thermoanaerobaculia bacterium]|nr:hypothetical protein [Thermoanaerobaculia bacterium]